MLAFASRKIFSLTRHWLHNERCRNDNDVISTEGRNLSGIVRHFSFEMNYARYLVARRGSDSEFTQLFGIYFRRRIRQHANSPLAFGKSDDVP
jgi:hypothetical protein